MKLNRSWLYAGSPSAGTKLSDWLIGAALDSPEVRRGLDQLTANTCLQATDSRVLTARAAEHIAELSQEWQQAETHLLEQLERVGGRPAEGVQATAEQRSVLMQLKRHQEEYLLRALADRGFLPSYGFPLNVVPFVNLTREEKSAKKKKRAEEKKANVNQDAPNVRQGFPSRQLAVGLQEYAPGASLVVDGTVFTSQGLTLNWKLPETSNGVKEVQSLQWQNRCRKCGELNISSQKEGFCVCGGDTTSSRFIRPAGFAVDIGARPGNDLSALERGPSVRQHISATPSTWTDFPTREAGAFRANQDGQLAVTSGQLFAVCLHCGRATPDLFPSDPKKLPRALVNHLPLRGGRFEEQDPHCTGNAHINPFAIIRGLRLGMTTRTDVLEFRLRDVNSGAAMVDKTIVSTLGVALAQASAEKLGIEQSEIGWSVNEYHSNSGSTVRSVVLFDTADGGAGYVTSLTDSIRELFERAKVILSCPADCDGACHQCLLSFQTQDILHELDRKSTLEFLTETFLDGLSLGHEEQVFGINTSFEPRSLLQILRQESVRANITEIRVFLGECVADWEPSSWPAWPELLRLSVDRSVSVVCSKGALERLEWDEKNQLSRMFEGTRVQLIETASLQREGTKFLALEFGGAARRIRVASSVSPEPNDIWGTEPEQSLVVARADEPLGAVSGDLIDPRSLEQPVPGQYTEITLGPEFEGRVDQFGQRLIDHLGGAIKGVKDLLAGSECLSELTYEDRYIASPIVALILADVLQSLRRTPGGVGQGTRIHVTTRPPSGDRYPNTIQDNFKTPKQQQEALEAVLGASAICTIDRRAPAHKRELKMTWPSGAVVVVRLDHGLGFVKALGRKNLNFNLSGDLLMKALNPAMTKVELDAPAVCYVAQK